MAKQPLTLETMFHDAPVKFETPEQEIAYLREQLAEKEQSVSELGAETSREQIAEAIVNEYQEQSTTDVLHENMRTTDEEAEGIALQLSPEEHDTQIEELFGHLTAKGIKNTLNIIAKLDNPHIDDDFHRFLVQYLQSQHTIPGLVNKSELYKALDMRLFEITLPPPDEDSNSARGLSELITMMEQLLAGMQSISSGRWNMEKNYYSLEVALSSGSDEVVFYACIPSQRVDLFEKQLLGLYSEAKMIEVHDDYNVFYNESAAAGSYAKARYEDALSLKTYDNIDHDPLNVLLNVFTKLDKETEGAAVQFMIRPVGDQYIREFSEVLEEVKQGTKISSIAGESKRWMKAATSIGKEVLFGQYEQDKSPEEKKIDENQVASITEKLKSSIVETNIRVVASAPDQERATDILHDIESAFNQFEETTGNAVAFERQSGTALKQFFHDYSYRMFNSKKVFRLNLKEISTMFHFPVATDSSPQLKQAKAGTAPVPVGIETEGVLLGVNDYRHRQTEVRMSPDDRVRHFYVIGQTGTGKTNILKNMIIQDIQNGEGVCFIDPHGSDIQDILAHIPQERIEDVVYFDPASIERPMGLNLLEYDPTYPEQKTFVVDELLGIFQKLYGNVPESMGPAFQQYFRNAAMLVVEDPDTGNTLLDISRVLADEQYRNLKLARCKNPIVVQFWEEIATKAGGEASLQNIVPYITNKFDVFVANEVMRPIIAQQRSAFNFRDIMDNQKILLVNLSKGRLGEINANLLGLIIVGKILMAALSRVDMDTAARKDFYLYIDEFQNVTTNSISQILSEARKYRLSLNIAHQFIAQLEDDIKNAVFGNVGSMAVFRVSADDAQYLESRFKPTFDASDIMKLDNYNAYLSMLANGQPVQPFNVRTLAPTPGNPGIVEKIKELSFLKYGRPRDEIEAEVMARYRKTPTPTDEKSG